MKLTETLDAIKARLEDTGAKVIVAGVDQYLASANMHDKCIILDYAEIAFDRESDSNNFPTVTYNLTADVVIETLHEDAMYAGIDLCESALNALYLFLVDGKYPVEVESITRGESTESTARYTISFSFSTVETLNV